MTATRKEKKRKEKKKKSNFLNFKRGCWIDATTTTSMKIREDFPNMWTIKFYEVKVK